MKFYIELKILSHAHLAELITQAHCTGIEFAFYFDNKNTFRIFSRSVALLSQFNSEILTVPDHVKTFVKCTRVRALERQTETQQAKRMAKLKEHLAKKGIEYKAKKHESTAEFDYFLNMKSLSSNKTFRLYVKNELTRISGNSEFSSYGLSLNNSTVPLF